MDRKRKRYSGPELEWTATRCQRLLRPIASRIAPLRRLSYITDSQRNSEALASSAAQSIILDPRGVRDKFDNRPQDPAWFPGQDRKSQIKKYSSRARLSQPQTKQTSSPQACMVMLPTPFKARALRRGTPIKQAGNMETSDSPIFERKQVPLRTKRGKNDPFARASIAKQSAELQNRQNYEKIFELHQGVSDGFSLLLQKTAPIQSGPPIHRGVPSLLKICLRRVPDYIQAEEEWRKSIDEDDDTDVCAEVYEELESLSSGHGWSGLRDVVIAHGVKLVGDLIKDQLVSRTTRAELAMMPLQYGLARETEGLSLAYAHSLPLKRPFDTNSPLFGGCLSGLEDIGFNGALSARKNVYVRILDDLFNSGRLRCSWLASRDMVKFSGEMIRSLASRSRETTDVVNFLYGRISTVSSTELSSDIFGVHGMETKLQSSVNKAMISIITVLTAIVLIERGTQQRTGSTMTLIPAETLLVNLGVDVLGKSQKCESDSELQKSDVCFAILTSNLMLETLRVSPESNRIQLRKEHLLQEMLRDSSKASGNNVMTMTERAANFICDLSRCCGQSVNSSSQEYLEIFVHSLLASSESGSRLEMSLLKQVALETSLIFAKTSATQQSRQFMETVEGGMMQKGTLASHLATTSHQLAGSERQGLRWEEGLCEWIAATPLAATRSRESFILKKSTSHSLSDLDEESEVDDSGYLSGVEATPAPQRRKLNMSQLLASPDVLGMDCDLRARSQTPIEMKSLVVESTKPTSTSYSERPAEEKFNNTKPSFQTRPQDAVTVALHPTQIEALPSLPTNRSLPETVPVTKAKKRKVQREGQGDKPKTTGSKRAKICPLEEDNQESFQLPCTASKPAAPVETASKSTSQDLDDEEDELALACRKTTKGRPRPPSNKSTTARSQCRKPSAKVPSQSKPTKFTSLDDSGDELGI